MAVMDIHPDSLAMLTGMLDEILPDHLVISSTERTEIATGLARAMFMRGVRVIQVTPDSGDSEASYLGGMGDGPTRGGAGPRLTLA